jgi:serine/threonine protein kinase
MPSKISSYTGGGLIDFKNMYKTVKTLGKGFTAKVKLARAPDGRTMAIKVFKLSNPYFNPNDIRKEVETLLSLKHPNIVEFILFQAD